MKTLAAILKRLAYHDLFDFPMTAQEIGGRDVAETMRLLSSDEARDAVSERNGLFCLKGREEIFAKRFSRYDAAEPKFARARRFFRFAALVPFLRAAFVCNTLAKSNARPESDIDIFAVAAPGRIWTTRLLVSGLASLLGIRRHGADVSDHLCMSFYVTSDALDLKRLAIDDDVYLAHWLSELLPIYDEAGIADLIARDNAWAAGSVPFRSPRIASRRAVPAPISVLKRCIERLIDATCGAALEAWAKKFQMSSIETKWRNQDQRSVGVTVSDTTLKFHEQDRRAEFRDRYRRKLAELGV
jgi:hypothetical protein